MAEVDGMVGMVGMVGMDGMVGMRVALESTL